MGPVSRAVFPYYTSSSCSLSSPSPLINYPLNSDRDRQADLHIRVSGSITQAYRPSTSNSTTPTPLKKFTSGSRKGQFGGELGIDLDATAGLGGMVGDGFSLIFMDTVSGTVYHKSKKFPIYAGAESPANYTTASLPDGPPATTATITAAPNPTQQWAITLDGTVVGGEVTSIAGGPGGGH
ncbi:hypothetical protein FFLO_02737 [Filobasidium floriforme]|uniref:Uncharacterized protein n=1 Tax=Filobasidium floriforme TaxID=5210 RepID=A0A8K0JSD2_9TREE|nr:hypothetical protein FFLO_02737 [Filobasidium floriforme]